MTHALPDHLAEAARLAHELSHEHCRGPDRVPGGCQPYHAAWPLLRLLGSITGAMTDRDFFAVEYGKVARAIPNARVLISGAADHCILEQVLRAFRGEDAEPRVTVIDACRTTLELNRWYAERVGARIETAVCDIRDHATDATFDLITTHSVLSFVPEPEYTALFARWLASLSERGKLVYAQGIRPNYTGPTDYSLGPAEIEHFVERVRDDFRRSDGTCGFGAKEVERLARGFAHAKRLLVIRGADGIELALRTSGFATESLQVVDRAGLPYKASDSSADDQALSLRLVAGHLPRSL